MRASRSGFIWKKRFQEAVRLCIRDRIIERIEYIPDEETELFFKAADVLVLPYTRIFQGGVLFLGYGFGLPVIASNVGSLREEIVEGKTGFVFKARDSSDLAGIIGKYFVPSVSPSWMKSRNRPWKSSTYDNTREFCGIGMSCSGRYSQTSWCSWAGAPSWMCKYPTDADTWWERVGRARAWLRARTGKGLLGSNRRGGG